MLTCIQKCETCGKADDGSSILVCDSCELGYHGYCLDPQVTTPPEYDWHCPKCLVGTGEFGFEEGGVYSLKQFQEKANVTTVLLGTNDVRFYIDTFVQDAQDGHIQASGPIACFNGLKVVDLNWAIVHS